MGDGKNILAATGLGGLGTLIGAIVGACGAGLLAALIVGMSAMNWYKAQPPDWYVITGFCAIAFVLIVAAIAALIGAVVFGLLVGLTSTVISAIMVANRK